MSPLLRAALMMLIAAAIAAVTVRGWRRARTRWDRGVVFVLPTAAAAGLAGGYLGRPAGLAVVGLWGVGAWLAVRKMSPEAGDSPAEPTAHGETTEIEYGWGKTGTPVSACPSQDCAELDADEYGARVWVRTVTYGPWQPTDTDHRLVPADARRSDPCGS